MIRTYVLPCRLLRVDADALSRESGRLYSSVLVQHWRIYHKHGLWLSPGADEKFSDFLTAADPPLLHAHSKDAAQQAFARACKTTRSLRAQGLTANFPHKRKYFRTTIWKNTAIRLRTAMLLLSRASGLSPISVDLPSSLAALPRNAFVEARLVYERCFSCYQWHLVVDDGQLSSPPPGAATVAVDMGEIHPAALTDGKTSLIAQYCRQRQGWQAAKPAQLAVGTWAGTRLHQLQSGGAGDESGAGG